MTRTTAALRKSAVSSVAPTDTTRTIAFGRGTGSEAVAARARVARPIPARSQSRCCANGRPRGWRSSCRPPPYCLCCGIERVDLAVIVAQGHRGQLSDRSGKLDAGRAGAHQHEGHLTRTFFRVIGRLRQFKRTQDLGSDRFSVVEALEAWRKARELVMTEIARTHSGRDHQEVILEFSTANPRASNLDGASSEIDAPNLRQQHAEVLLFRFKLTDWRRYLGWRQNSGGDLVQERLK